MNWKSVCFDWNRTRAFLVTAEEGTLSAAAKALNMTQPTLSRQVASLEQEIGVRLFERVGQRLELTSSGIDLLQLARKMGDAASDFSLMANGQSQQLEGTVVISVCELDAVYRLPRIIAKLRKVEPRITIEVIVSNKVSDLNRRDADIAIRSFCPTQPDLIARKLGEETVWLYGTEEYLKYYTDVNSLKEIEDIQVIGFSDSSLISNQLNQQGWNLSPDNFKLSTDHQMMQISLCKESLGLIYLTQDVGDQEPTLVKALQQFGPTICLPVWAVCHQELRTNRRIRRVFDFISNELKEYLSQTMP
ncbi:LysR family transcriptional regulator [Vibrio genomosp. F10]|uniref:LysR family transcriptional regulator n=2 Tax=Vibrio genomosp. F10 TaxID=723171 RepID=A0A1B9R0V5_9VIBR|nr:LysR family transcriptional regulator [Vibrio genomosp. F10]OCH77890.1 LysR family transcriptional regulator [Vibrio genomosp. F10]OEE37490.1 LysR family transcriptional regulator [Vibrio genomosp. F10 str. ZF-129]OEE93063.1 LysR family transcriptional regulator [Vibrio genomosp. F10 str. 9ZC157]OEF03721.1 LysR family transcriptional regulator [Vibrio genomosp. F10 str. 9ZD137]